MQPVGSSVTQNKSGCCGNHCWFIFVVWCGYCSVCFFIEPVHTAIPRNYLKSRIWDLEERVGGEGVVMKSEVIPRKRIYPLH